MITGSLPCAREAFTAQRREETHTYVATHPQASHPHCSYYDPSSSPTDLLIIAALKRHPSHTHTRTHVAHNIRQTTPLMMSTFSMFHKILYNEPMPHTETKKVNLDYTFQTSTVLALCNLVLLTLLLPGQMEPL